MKVAIVGSRDFPDRTRVEDYIGYLASDTVVISGGARGVDTWAADAAAKRGLRVEIIRADWSKHPRSAGMIRNAKIVASCDAVVAFHYNESLGTANTIAGARAAGKPVYVVNA